MDRLLGRQPSPRDINDDIARGLQEQWNRLFGPALSESNSGQRDSKTPNTGTPGNWVTNPGSGQERQYGADGKPSVDIDSDHDHGQGNPHAQNWDRGPNGELIRGEGSPFSKWPGSR